MRSASLRLYPAYADASIRLSRAVPGSAAQGAIAAESLIQRRLWRLAGQALDAQPIQSAPRLYVDSLNAMIDIQTTRVAALNNRVPVGDLARRGHRRRGRAGADGGLPRDVLPRLVTVLLAAALVTLLLFVTFDLDRPARGFITVPDAPLVALRAGMELPPAADAPR